MSEFKTALMQQAMLLKRDESFVDVVIRLLKEVDITEVEHFMGTMDDYTFETSMTGSKSTFMKKLFEKFAPPPVKTDGYECQAMHVVFMLFVVCLPFRVFAGRTIERSFAGRGW